MLHVFPFYLPFLFIFSITIIFKRNMLHVLLSSSPFIFFIFSLFFKQILQENTLHLFSLYLLTSLSRSSFPNNCQILLQKSYMRSLLSAAIFSSSSSIFFFFPFFLQFANIRDPTNSSFSHLLKVPIEIIDSPRQMHNAILCKLPIQ